MDLLLQLLLEVLLLGAFYGFMSLGFSLTWGVLNILNLAYGSFVVLGSYIAYTAYVHGGVDPLISIPLSAGTGFFVGTALQRLLIDRAMKMEPFMVLILTFGMDILIAHSLNLVFKADVRSIDTPYAEESFLLGSLIIVKVKLLVFLTAVFLTLALYLFLKYTWTGRAIRAVALDREGATLVGINPSKVFLIASGIGTAIAFSSGNLYGLMQGFTPFDGALLTVKAFLISVLGGLGRVESALIGGLALSFVEIFVGFYAGEGWKFFASLILLVFVLIVRPRGLLGGKYYGEA